MPDRHYGFTSDGVPITDDVVERLAEEAEAGFEVDEILRRRGEHGRSDDAARGIDWLHLDPDLHERLRQRARDEGSTPSAVIRSALRRYLGAA